MRRPEAASRTAATAGAAAVLVVAPGRGHQCECSPGALPWKGRRTRSNGTPDFSRRREGAVGKRDDVGPVDMNVAVQIADHVRRRARPPRCRAGARRSTSSSAAATTYDCLGVAMEQLAGVQHRAGGELQRQDCAVRRLDETPDRAAGRGRSSAIPRRQIRRRFGVMGGRARTGMEDLECAYQFSASQLISNQLGSFRVHR